MITWIIGSGGLLGAALARQARGHIYRPGPIPWHDPDLASLTLHRHARAFEQQAQEQRWRVVWAAGAATTATPADEAYAELAPLTGLITGLRSALPSGHGSFVLASSAGGIYAGAGRPPFTTATAPAPLSPYGELKLAQEDLATSTLSGLANVLVARLSNLYGPGQDLTKLQGLISHLAKSAITRQPVNIFMPLDTTRDYIYAADAAETLLEATDNPGVPFGTRTEIVASGRGTTIAQLIRTMNEVTKRRVPVALGTHASAQAQAIDLRVVATLAPSRPTPLAAGMKNVYQGLLQQVQAAMLMA